MNPIVSLWDGENRKQSVVMSRRNLARRMELNTNLLVTVGAPPGDWYTRTTCRKEKQGILKKCIWFWSPRLQKKTLKLGCSEILFSHSPAIWESEQKDVVVAQLTRNVSQGMMMNLALPLLALSCYVSQEMMITLSLPLLELPRRPHMWLAPFMHRTHQHVNIAKRVGMDSLKVTHITEGTWAWFFPQGPACSVLF